MLKNIKILTKLNPKYAVPGAPTQWIMNPLGDLIHDIKHGGYEEPPAKTIRVITDEQGKLWKVEPFNEEYIDATQIRDDKLWNALGRTMENLGIPKDKINQVKQIFINQTEKDAI